MIASRARRDAGPGLPCVHARGRSSPAGVRGPPTATTACGGRRGARPLLARRRRRHGLALLPLVHGRSVFLVAVRSVLFAADLAPGAVLAEVVDNAVLRDLRPVLRAGDAASTQWAQHCETSGKSIAFPRGAGKAYPERCRAQRRVGRGASILCPWVTSRSEEPTAGTMDLSLDLRVWACTSS